MDLLRRNIWSIFALCLFAIGTNAQVAANVGWLSPAASVGDFAEQDTNRQTVPLSWQPMNHSRSDLWITAYDTSTNGFAKFIEGDINLRIPGTWEWTAGIAGVVIDADNRFVLRFVEHGAIFYPSMTDQIPSPAFTLQRRSKDASNNTISSTTTESSSSVSTSATSQTTIEGAGLITTSAQAFSPTSAPSTVAIPSSRGDDLSDGALAGIVVGAVAGLVLFLGLGFLIGTRHRRRALGRLEDEKTFPPGTAIDLHEQTYNRHLSIMTSPNNIVEPSRYSSAREFTGSNKQPVELDGGEPGHDSNGTYGSHGITPTITRPSQSGTFSPISPPRGSDSNPE